MAKQLYTNRHFTLNFTKIPVFTRKTKSSNYLASNKGCWQTCSGKGATEMLTACEVDGGCGNRWYSSSVMKGMKGESNRKPQSSTRYNVSLAADTACASPLANTGFRHSCYIITDVTSVKPFSLATKSLIILTQRKLCEMFNQDICNFGDANR